MEAVVDGNGGGWWTCWWRLCLSGMAADRRPGTRRGRGGVSLPPTPATTAPASSAEGVAGRGGWEAPRLRCVARICVAVGGWSVSAGEATPCRGAGRSRWGSTGGAARAIGSASRSPFPEGAGGAALGIGRSAAAAPAPAAPAPAPVQLGESAGVGPGSPREPPPSGEGAGTRTASTMRGPASSPSSWRGRVSPCAEAHARPPSMGRPAAGGG